MFKIRFNLSVMVGALLLIQCTPKTQTTEAPTLTPVEALASLIPRQDGALQGAVTFSETPDGVRVRGHITGLPPDSKHGFHIHAGSQCELPDFLSAEGHFNPQNKPHGGRHGAERHAGDLGNISTNNRGEAIIEFTVHGITIGHGDSDIVGRTLVLHDNADDLQSQPTGDAGDRLACGLIQIN
jgi:superoxide dismutase, Cu-Zn family